MRKIDADALKDKISNIRCYVKSPEMAAGFVEAKAKALREIEAALTSESEARHGRWLMNNPYGIKCCSECGYGQSTGAENYCPNCGADMREEGEDATD